MTIVVTVKVTDGIVLASDSATTFMDHNGIPVKVYNNANKIFNLVKGLPIGAMTFGSGSVGTASIATLSKDMRKHFSNPESQYYFDHANFSIEEVAKKARDFFIDRMKESYPNGVENYLMGYRICGYGTLDTLAEGWEFVVQGDAVSDPTPFYEAGNYGPRWNGDREALDRLILGFGRDLMPALIDAGLDPANSESIRAHLNSRTYQTLSLPAMPIQDAVELAKFLAETASKFSHFSLQAPTIGGPIELATITKHEGFKWVARKHYFNSSFNPE